MAWPTANVVLTNVDADSDSISSARADIYSAFVKLNEIITNGPGSGNVTVYNDDNVAAFLPNYTGNLRGNYITTTSGIYWSNGAAYSTGGGGGGGSSYGNVEVAALLETYGGTIGTIAGANTALKVSTVGGDSYWLHQTGSSGSIRIGSGGGGYFKSTDEAVILYSEASSNPAVGNIRVDANPNQTNYFLVQRPSIFTDTTELGPYKETVYVIGNSGSGTITPNVSLGPVQTITATGNFTLAAPTNMTTGSSLCFVIRQDGTGSRTCTFDSSYKFSGGSKTLSTAASSIDVVTVFYDGTDYLCNLIKGYS